MDNKKSTYKRKMRNYHSKQIETWNNIFDKIEKKQELKHKENAAKENEQCDETLKDMSRPHFSNNFLYING